MSIERGKFILFEGVGGAGKTAQIDKAYTYLAERMGVRVVKTREPGGVRDAEEIREIIFDLKRGGVINSDVQTGLFFASRLVLKNALIKPYIDNGTHVLSDRSYPSTGAYQGYGEGADLDVIEKISQRVMRGCMPDGIVLLNISAGTAMSRNNDCRDGDPFDDEGLRFQERVINGYQEMAASGWSGVPWYVIDGERSIDAVHEDVKGVLHDILGLDIYG